MEIVRLPQPTVELKSLPFRIFVFVILPLATGCATYLFLRQQPPLFLQGFPELFLYRTNCAVFDAFFCNSYFLKYILPDAAWAFSFTSLMAILVKNDKKALRLTYMALTVMLIALSELSQLYVDIGTFDELDLIAELTAATIASIISFGERNEAARH